MIFIIGSTVSYYKVKGLNKCSYFNLKIMQIIKSYIHIYICITERWIECLYKKKK